MTGVQLADQAAVDLDRQIETAAVEAAGALQPAAEPLTAARTGCERWVGALSRLPHGVVLLGVERPQENAPAAELYGQVRLDLEEDGVALAAARADGCQPEPAAVPPQLVDHRREDARARGTDWMTERDGAPVHVHLLRVGAEHLRRVEDDRRERLIELDALDVLDLPTGLPEGQLPRLCRRAREIGEVVRDVCLRDDRGEDVEAALARVLLARNDEGAGAVVDAGRVTRGRRAVRVEDRLEPRQLLERRVPARPLVDGDVVDGDDLVLEQAVVDGLDGALVRAERPLVLILAADPKLPRDERRLLDHVALVERRREAVVHHHVDDDAVPEAVAEAGLLEDVGRVRHRLHAAGHDDAVVAGADHLVGHLDSTDAGGTYLVDRVRADLDRQAGADGCLARRGLAGAALEHLPHDHVLDLVVLDPGAVECGPDGDGAELGRLPVLETSAELPEGRADGRD